MAQRIPTGLIALATYTIKASLMTIHNSDNQISKDKALATIGEVANELQNLIDKYRAMPDETIPANNAYERSGF